MAQVLLDRTGINPFVGQIKTTGMPEHMGMNRKREPCDLASPQHNMAHRACGQRPAPFRDKQIGSPSPLQPIEDQSLGWG